MINWTVPAISFGLAAVLAAWLDGRFQRRAGWSKRRRMLNASLPLPLLIVVASACGMVWELLRTRTGENMTDLVIAVYVTLGALFALVTFGGGLFGARLAERKQEQ